MTYGESNGQATDDITRPCKVKLVTLNTPEPIAIIYGSVIFSQELAEREERVNFMLLGVLHDYLIPVYLDKQ